jgi:hypothetical protein
VGVNSHFWWTEICSHPFLQPYFRYILKEVVIMRKKMPLLQPKNSC